MKTKIIYTLLLLTITSINSFTQEKKSDYIPLAVENARWLILLDIAETPYPDEYYGYKIKGDTIIDGTAYKKVYKRDFYSVNEDWIPPYVIANEHLFGVIRDDVTERKVYGIIFDEDYPHIDDCPNNEEILMYDFSMEVGDYYDGHCLVMDGSLTCIESIDYFNFAGQDRLRQITESVLDYIVEGVGSYDYGLFESIGGNLSGWWTELHGYCVGTDAYCYDGFLLAINEQHIIPNISMYPNPVSDELTIKSENTEIRHINIFDILGKKLLSYDNPPNQIDLTSLENSLYFIEIITPKGKTIKKIIKK